MTDFAQKSARLAQLRAEGKASVSYEIVIDEPQRLALMSVINYATSQGVAPTALEYWMDMLKSLPADEAEAPGILHGFCL